MLRLAVDKLDNFEDRLLAQEEKIDESRGDDSDHGKARYCRAEKAVNDLERKIQTQRSLIRQAEATRDAISAYSSPWKAKMIDCLGETLNQIVGSTNTPATPSAVALIEAPVPKLKAPQRG